jgi:hypothetical protein
MSERILKFKTNEVATTANTTVSNSSLVRLYNNTAAVAVVTIASSNAANLGQQFQYSNATVGAGQEAFIYKSPTDTVQATGCLAVGVAIVG